MQPTARRSLIFGLFALALLPVVLLVPYYADIYAALEPYHVEGVAIGWLGSYVLANLCAPGFMQGAGSKTEYENSGPRTIATLYLSVMMITFGALAVVVVVLWILGWLWVLITLPLYIMKEWLKDLLTGQIG